MYKRQEHDRVFGRLVVALGHRQQDHVAVMTQIETGRAHQITDILDKQNIELRQIELIEGAMNQVRVQMTGGTGGDLVGGCLLYTSRCV